MPTVIMKNGGRMEVASTVAQEDGSMLLMMPDGNSVQVPGHLVARTEEAATKSKAPDVAKARPDAATPELFHGVAREALMEAADEVNSGRMPYYQAMEQAGFDGGDMGLQLSEQAFHQAGIERPLEPDQRAALDEYYGRADAMRAYSAAQAGAQQGMFPLAPTAPQPSVPDA